VTVAGAGSQLNSFALHVAYNGQGTLNIQNGGVVNSADGEIAYNSGSSVGVVTVTGPGSQWNISGALDVNGLGHGTLNITNGGLVADASAKVGQLSVFGASGSVLVDAGTWTTTSLLTIGTGGPGAVTVKDGGDLSAGSMIIGGAGSLTVDPATVDVLGDFTLMPNGVLTFDIAGTTPDLISQLYIGGSGLFEGTINIDFINGFAPTTGDSFDIIKALGGADFSQATFDVLGLAPGFQYFNDFSGGDFTLTALNDGVSNSESGIPEPGSAWLVGGVLTALSLVALRKRLKAGV